MPITVQNREGIELTGDSLGHLQQVNNVFQYRYYGSAEIGLFTFLSHQYEGVRWKSLPKILSNSPWGQSLYMKKGYVFFGGEGYLFLRQQE